MSQPVSCWVRMWVFLFLCVSKFIQKSVFTVSLGVHIFFGRHLCFCGFGCGLSLSAASLASGIRMKKDTSCLSGWVGRFVWDRGCRRAGMGNIRLSVHRSEVLSINISTVNLEALCFRKVCC